MALVNEFSRLRRIKSILYFWVCCSLCVLFVQPPAAAAGGNAIIERAYLEDPTNALELKDVRSGPFAQQFKSYAGPLNRGYSKSAIWLKLTLRPLPNPSSYSIFNTQGSGQLYVLRVQPSYLDEIALHDPEDLQNSPRFVGDRHPVDALGYRSLNHNFVISMGEQPKNIWLRLKTSSTSLIHVEALPMERAIAKDGLQYLLLGGFIGFLFLFFGWALVHWLDHREPLIGVLAINQFIALVFTLSILGYFRFMFGEHVPGPWLDKTSSILSLVATASSLFFNYKFLLEFDPPKLGRLVLALLVSLLPLELLMIAAGWVREAMQLNMGVVTLSPFFFIGLVLKCRIWSTPTKDRRPVFSKLWLLFFYGVSLLLLMAFALPSLGLLPSSEMALQTNSIYGFVTGLVLIVTLQLRSRRLQESHLEAQKNLEMAKQQVAQETKQRQEQVQFMAMLTHELKTPLSVVRMALGLNGSSQKIKTRADQAIQDMSNVIDRCAWIDRLHEREFAIKKSEFDIVKELERLVFVSNTQGQINITSNVGACHVESDVRMVGTILNNLMDNALKYAQPGSRIDVQVDHRVFEVPARVVVEISNLPGNSGWPEAAKVFEKYYRSPGARHQTGSGLGLYQAENIAQQLGGSLRYVPHAQCVRFQFCLPC